MRLYYDSFFSAASFSGDALTMAMELGGPMDNVLDQRWYVLRHHQNDILKEMDAVLRVFVNELLPCATFDEYADVLSILPLVTKDAPNMSRWMQQLESSGNYEPVTMAGVTDVASSGSASSSASASASASAVSSATVSSVSVSQDAHSHVAASSSSADGEFAVEPLPLEQSDYGVFPLCVSVEAGESADAVGSAVSAPCATLHSSEEQEHEDEEEGDDEEMHDVTPEDEDEDDDELDGL